VLSTLHIKYVFVSGDIYAIPSGIEVGVKEYEFDADSFEIGMEYDLITKHNTKITLTLSEIVHKSRVDTEVCSAYRFMDKEAYNLKYNLYPPTQKAYGVKLSNYIVGSNKQFDIAIWGLRKGGLHLYCDSNFKVSPIHIKEHQSSEDMAISNITNSVKLRGHPTRKNYGSVEDNGSVGYSQKGNGVALYIPTLKASDIKSLDSFIEPKYIIQSSSDNLHLDLGQGVLYKKEKYCIMKKNTIYYKHYTKTLLELGLLI